MRSPFNEKCLLGVSPCAAGRSYLALVSRSREVPFGARVAASIALTLAHAVCCRSTHDTGSDVHDGDVGVLGEFSPSTSSSATDLSDTLPSPVRPHAIQVVTKARRTCAVLDDGSVRCWGLDRYGSLGIGTLVLGIHHSPVVVPHLRNIKKVALGGRHTCALERGGSVWCWGANDVGQLGVASGDFCRLDDNRGPLPCAPTPMLLSGLTDVVDIGVGERHTCAVSGSGFVYCWGAADQGQVGARRAPECTNYKATCVASPTLVTGATGALSVAAGLNHTCVLANDSSVKCWGDNSAGELGRGTRIASDARPASVKGLVGVQAIASHDRHSCAVRIDGSLRCWGESDCGRMGVAARDACIGPELNECVCTRVPLAVPAVHDVGQVAVGPVETCAMLLDGSLLCTGYDIGALALDGDASCRIFGFDDKYVSRFRRMSRVPSLSSVSTGGTNACGISKDGDVWCWGRSDSGELGAGQRMCRTNDSTCVEPVRVTF